MTSLGSLCRLHYPYNKEVLPGVHTKPLLFQSVPTVSCLGTKSHQKEPDSLLIAPSLQEFIYTDEILPEPPFLYPLELSQMIPDESFFFFKSNLDSSSEPAVN